jgi:hypothetical protein
LPILPSDRTCYFFLSSDFAEEKTKKIKKHDFLLVWIKDIYTGGFLVLFPCVYVLQTPTGSPLSVLFTRPYSTFQGVPGQFKISIFFQSPDVFFNVSLQWFIVLIEKVFAFLC